jgi:WXG100 protein secretion system (Wss), protein YukD
MRTLLITIATPNHQVDLEIPAEVPIADLLPSLVKLCVSGLWAHHTPQWSLWSSETHAPLDLSYSLLDADIVDGATLTLQAVLPTEKQADNATFQPETLQPSRETGGIGVRWNIPR